MRKVKRLGLCLLAAAAVAIMPQSEARADTQGSSSWKNPELDNTADLYVKMVDDDGDMITAAQVDVLLSVSNTDHIENVEFSFDDAWADLNVAAYHYDEASGNLTIIIANDGKTGLASASAPDEEFLVGTLSVESSEPVRAIIESAKAVSDGALEDVVSIHGIEVSLAATIEEEQMGSFTGRVELSDGTPLDGVVIEVLRDGIVTKTATTDNGEFDMELPYGEYTARVKEAPDGYVIDTNEFEITVSENGTSHTWTAEIKEEEPDPEVRDITLIVKDKDGNPVSNVSLKITGEDFNRTFVTDSYGRIKLEDLPYGNYQVTVVNVPDGYQVTVKEASFEVSESGVTNFTLEVEKKEDPKPDAPKDPDEDDPTKPTDPVKPDDPTDPTDPADPENPEDPTKPAEPQGPEETEPQKPEQDNKPEISGGFSGSSSDSSSSGSSSSGSSSSGGSSSGSKSSGSSKSSVKSNQSNGSETGPGFDEQTKPTEYVTVNTGTWTYDPATDRWTLDGNKYKNQWIFVHNSYASVEQGQDDWFRFDAEGNMLTGWFTDEAGLVYYLNETPDGTRGKMVTGWVQIGGNWYYFSEVSDGTKGHMLRSTTTPDGYIVDPKGVWIGR